MLRRLFATKLEAAETMEGFALKAFIMDRGRSGFLHKPCKTEDISRKIREILDACAEVFSKHGPTRALKDYPQGHQPDAQPLHYIDQGSTGMQ